MSGLFNNGNYAHELFQDVAKCLKEANRLPSLQDFQYFLGFQEFDSGISEQEQKVLNLISKFSEFFGHEINTFKDASKASKVCLDTVKTKLESFKSPQGLQESLIYTLPKPQDSFPEPPDNSYSSHIPRLLHKEHGKKDIPAGIIKAQQLKMLNFRPEKVDHYEEITHPYSFELESLVYLPSQYDPKPSSFVPLECSPFDYIDTQASLSKMLEELKQSKEIAVDLENHSIRSYQGLCCLIQISTRTKDYVIDALALRPHLESLAVIFANPEVVKVFHGSDNDVEWLQRDFSVYVVNLFDTALAAKELKYASCGLGFLLKSFCDVDSDKRYQLADWRLRPLPVEMMKYARSDTHFLLFIYDRLREELIHKSKAIGEDPKASISKVLELSRVISLKIYNKPAVPKDPNNSEYYKLCKARDLIARLEDENPEFIMPHTLLLAIASEKPNSLEELLAIAENSYLEKYGKYLFSVIRSNKKQKENFSNDFFKDADWVDTQKLPFSEVYEKMKRTEYGFDDVLSDVSEILNSASLAGEGFDEVKNGKSLDSLLDGCEVNENLIPKSLNEIFELSNSSRKKNKNKVKNLAEVTSPEKTVSLNLQKVFKDIGWE